MKKIISVILACLMVMGAGTVAFAEDSLESQLAGVSVKPAVVDFDSNEKSVMDRADLTSSTDIVTLTESSVTVETADGLMISYEYPNQYVFCLTQDLEQQAYLYMIFYTNNMVEQASNFVKKGMHLNIYDFDSGADIYLYTDSSLFASIIQNLNALSEEDVAVVEGLIAQEYFPSAKSVTSGMVGENLWIFADMGTGGVLLTFVNGCEVSVIFKYTDDSGPLTALSLLETLSITAA